MFFCIVLEARGESDMQKNLTQCLDSLAHIASLIISGSEIADVFERISRAVCQRSQWSSSAIMAVDEDSGFSLLLARHDPYFDTGKNTHLPNERWDLATSPTRQVVASRRPLIIPDAQLTEEHPGYQADAVTHDYRTVVLLPLSAVDDSGRAIVMSVHAHDVCAVDDEELVFLQTVTHLASLALEKAHHLQAEQRRRLQLQEARDVHTAMMGGVLEGQPLETLLDLVSTRLPMPLLLVDLTSNKILAQGTPANWLIDDEHWTGLMLRNGIRHLGHVMRDAANAEGSSRQSLNLAPIGLALVVEAIIAPCLVDDAVLGGFIFFPGERSLTDIDALMIEEARFALAVQLMRSHVRFTAQTETHSELFSRLFSSNWRDRQETLARASRLGLPLADPARLTLLRLAPEGQKRLNPGMIADIERSLTRIAHEATPGATAFVSQDAFVVFLPDIDGSEKSLRLLLGRLIDEMQWIVQWRPAAALSRLCHQLEDYPAARQDCARMLDLALRAGQTGLIGEGSFGPFAKLAAALDQTALQNFIDDTLGRIAAHDAVHRADLVPTLQAFLEAGCRYQVCADQLGIHVTTLRYRLKRLSELFDLDLEDPEMRLTLEVAFRLRRFMRPN